MSWVTQPEARWGSCTPSHRHDPAVPPAAGDAGLGRGLRAGARAGPSGRGRPHPPVLAAGRALSRGGDRPRASSRATWPAARIRTVAFRPDGDATDPRRLAVVAPTTRRRGRPAGDRPGRLRGGRSGRHVRGPGRADRGSARASPGPTRSADLLWPGSGCSRPTRRSAALADCLRDRGRTGAGAGRRPRSAAAGAGQGVQGAASGPDLASRRSAEGHGLRRARAAAAAGRLAARTTWISTARPR